MWIGKTLKKIQLDRVGLISQKPFPHFHVWTVNDLFYRPSRLKHYDHPSPYPLDEPKSTPNIIAKWIYKMTINHMIHILLLMDW